MASHDTLLLSQTRSVVTNGTLVNAKITRVIGSMPSNIFESLTIYDDVTSVEDGDPSRVLCTLESMDLSFS